MGINYFSIIDLEIFLYIQKKVEISFFLFLVKKDFLERNIIQT